MTIADRQHAAMEFANAEHQMQLAYNEFSTAKTRYENAKNERDRVHKLLIDVGAVGSNVTSRLFRIDSTRNVLLEYNWHATDTDRVSARVIQTEPASNG